jgi:sorbitol-specific phosphotransferase system component IIC
MINELIATIYIAMMFGLLVLFLCSLYVVFEDVIDWVGDSWFNRVHSKIMIKGGSCTF